MKYCGCVTDISFWNAIHKLPIEDRKKYQENDTMRLKYWAGFDVVFSLGRLPRVFIDEYKKGGNL